jgi:hypothetical protein
MRSALSDILPSTDVAALECSSSWASISSRALLLMALAVLAVVPALCSASAEEWTATAALLAGALSVRFAPSNSFGHERRDRWCGSLWGASIPLLPWFGDAGIVAVSIGMVCIVGGLRVRLRRTFWIAPLLCMIAGAVTAEVWRLAPQYFGAVVINDFARTLSAMAGFLDTHAHSWRYLSHLVMFGLVVALFEGAPHVFRGVRRGLGIGVACAALVTIAQFFDLLTGVVPNQSAFWTGIHRLSGSFSDPNAQGIFLSVAPFLIFGGMEGRARGRWFVGVLSILMACAGLLSGSRSFVLALILALLAAVWMFSRRLLFFALLAGAVFVAGVSLLDLYTTWFEQWLSSNFIPEGGRRVLMTCSLSRVSESFFSRSVFFMLGRELFDHFPLFGVGVDQFRFYVPALNERLGLNIAGWVDNSNNFYLGLLTELGLLGTFLFVLTVRGRTLVRERGVLCLVGLFVLASVLVTGPHLDFPEVLFLAAGLVAASTRPRELRMMHTVTFACVGMVVGFVGVFTREQGGYPWELRQGRFEQWLSPAAVVSVACSCEGVAELALESSYVPKASPLVVSVRASNGDVRQLNFTEPEAQKVTFRCRDTESVAHDHHPGTITLSITTAPGWSPARAWPGKTSDMRTLGVKMRHRRSEDLLGPPRCTRAPMT